MFDSIFSYVVNINITLDGAIALANGLRTSPSYLLLDNIVLRGIFCLKVTVGTSIGEKGCITIVNALKCYPNIKTLDFSGLVTGKIGDKGASVIAEFLSISKKLKVLTLSSNVITDEGATLILEILETNQSIVSLNLEGNFLSPKMKFLFITEWLRRMKDIDLFPIDKSLDEKTQFTRDLKKLEIDSQRRSVGSHGEIISHTDLHFHFSQ